MGQQEQIANGVANIVSYHRYLEAEGIEKTYRYKQKDIATAVPLASSLQVSSTVAPPNKGQPPFPHGTAIVFSLCKRTAM